MSNKLIALVTLALSIVSWSASAQQEPARLALLIGNQGYAAKVGVLKNPHRDVDLVAAALKKDGFRVTILKDATYKQMDTALKRYVTEVRRAGPGSLSFFYYSGHGVANPETQINYLVPIDVADADDDKIWFESFQQTAVIDLLSRQAPAATHYLVFDACRNELNVGGTNAKSIGSDKGFVPIADTSGLLIAYATAPKRTASDVGQDGGPYARVLAEELVKPGVESVSMFRNVQIKVKQTIGQDPWLSFPSLPPVYLAGRAPEAATPPQPVTVPQAPMSPHFVEAERLWERLKESSDPVALEAFAARYGDTFFGDQAKARLGVLKAEGDRQRIALLQQQDEARKTAEVQAAKNKAEAEAASATEPGRVFRDCPDCPEMVAVAAGSFTMGSGEYDNEKPPHSVTIPKPFAVGKFAVTFDEWDACVGAGACKTKPADEGWGRGKRPVINVSWDDISKEYLPWLSKKSGKSYRLLTEAEWEYAARAGTTTKYSWGDDIGKNNANCDGCGTQWESKQTAPVGSFEPNAFGLYDMHGNVWQWVQDCYHDSYNGAPKNGSAVSTGDCSLRVLRGGSWYFNPRYLRAAFRVRGQPGSRSRDVGFRLARTLIP